MLKWKLLSTFTLVIFYTMNLCAQTEPITVYSDLEIKHTYEVNTSSSKSGGVYVYRVNGESVTKEIYDKYQDGWENMASCCPCILLSYDEDDVLLSEAVSCTDCYVGSYLAFYANGNLKIKGQYKENPTNDWKDISHRGYCHVKVGQWIYYKKNGKIKEIEVWEDGTLVE